MTTGEVKTNIWLKSYKSTKKNLKITWRQSIKEGEVNFVYRKDEDKDREAYGREIRWEHFTLMRQSVV